MPESKYEMPGNLQTNEMGTVFDKDHKEKMPNGMVNQDENQSVYDLPLINKWLDQSDCARYVPILPQFKGFSCKQRHVYGQDTGISNTAFHVTQM